MNTTTSAALLSQLLAPQWTTEELLRVIGLNYLTSTRPSTRDEHEDFLDYMSRLRRVLTGETSVEASTTATTGDRRDNAQEPIPASSADVGHAAEEEQEEQREKREDQQRQQDDEAEKDTEQETLLDHALAGAEEDEEEEEQEKKEEEEEEKEEVEAAVEEDDQDDKENDYTRLHHRLAATALSQSFGKRLYRCVSRAADDDDDDDEQESCPKKFIASCEKNNE